MAKTYGNTWWGDNWLKSLNNIDYANRIPRGAFYARNGRVVSLKTKGNHITAKVKGSNSYPYTVTIIIPPFSEAQVNLLMEQVIKRPAMISKLLNRDLDPEVLDIAQQLNLKVFPSQWDDFKMNCSCPDWAVPCKHLAATIYTISREIDNNPFLIFEIHNVNLLKELNKRGITIDDKKSIVVPNLVDLMIRKKEKDVSLINPPFRKIDFTQLQNITEPISRLLPSSPVFYNNGDFQEKYTVAFAQLVKKTQKVFSSNFSASKIFKLNDPLAKINPNCNYCITLYDNVRTNISTSYSGNNTEHYHSNITSNEDISKLLFELPSENLIDYHPSILAIHQAFFCALHLLANGAILPQIVSLTDKKYTIHWIPCYIDPKVRLVISELEKLFSGHIIMGKVAISKLKFSIFNPGATLVSYFLSKLIPKLSKDEKDDIFIGLFFKNNSYSFNKAGETEIPGGIQTWLDHYMLAKSKFRPMFIVSEEVGKNHFLLEVAVEDCDLQKTISINKILTEKEYEKERFNILKEITMLSSMVDGLDNYINKGGISPIILNYEAFTPFLIQTIPSIRLLNIKVLLPKSLQGLLRPKTSMRVSKKSVNEKSFLRLDDLLEFDWQIAIGDNIITPEEFNKLLQNASGLIKFKQKYIYVDLNDIEKIHKALNQPQTMSNAQLLQVALSEEHDSAPIRLSEEVRELIKELNSPTEIEVPQSINAELRPYQKRGFSWMYKNMRIGFGSILADDMGLGKTLQVITLLQKIKDEGALIKAKVLLIVPTGLLFNWRAELERFAPNLTFFIFHGTGRDISKFDADIMLTTYGILRSDKILLKKKKWQVAIIDEAQNIKNYYTEQSKTVRSISAGTHIAMSGTPVENRLSEFWSIMDFANKGYLGNNKNFYKEYAKPIQLSNDMQIIERFRKITAPFMMRRLKSDKTIISDLPEKIEKNQITQLTKEQSALYQKVTEEAIREIQGMEVDSPQSLFKRQGLILQMILALKQVCNHPALFLKNKILTPELSGKTEMLLDIIDSIVRNNEKVLIFTQFREMGDILQKVIKERMGISTMFYHGRCSIKDREAMIDRFQNNHTDRVFILSLKAAGTGLNLTAASHVIHYDLWWNPAVEAQATDRAYRIGQNKNVVVHRFITKDTFEEKIDKIIQDKKHLADMTVTSGESWIGKLSNDELYEMFK